MVVTNKMITFATEIRNGSEDNLKQFNYGTLHCTILRQSREWKRRT